MVPRSIGEGIHLTTASSSGWIPLFLKAVPQRTGLILLSHTPLRITAWISEAEIHAVMRKGVCVNKINPVLCGTAFKNKGIQPLLDAVVKWMPSPIDRGTIHGIDIDTGEPIDI